MSVCLLPLWARDSELGQSAFLSRMETRDVLHLLFSRWTKTLNLEYLFPHRLEAQNVVVSVAASKAGDLVSVIVSLDVLETQNECVCCCYPCGGYPSERVYLLVFLLLQDWDSELGVSVCISHHAGRRLRTLVICFCLSPYRTETQNKEGILKGYLYPFPMKRRLQFGASPSLSVLWLAVFIRAGEHSVHHPSFLLWNLFA